MKKLIPFFILFAFFTSPVLSQEHHDQFKRHRISVMWGNTLVPAAKNAHDEESDLLFPTWGLNYEYWFSRNFAIGIQNEFEMMSYIVEHGSDAVLEREYPFISSVVFVYEPIHRFALFIGPGYEFEANESFFIVKVGAGYVFKLPNSFDLGIEVSYDNKNKLYDAWTFGLVIGKMLGKER